MKRIGIAVVGIGLCLTAVAQQATQTQAVAASWIDATTVSGDLSLRFEHIDEEGRDSRQRDRIRARLGAVSEIADGLKTGFELATGQDNPVALYQTMGDGFDRKDIRLNQAYIEWAPCPGALLTGGKMHSPFADPGCLVLDSDVTPEGLALQGARDCGALRLDGSAGYFWLQERSAAEDAHLYAGQVTARYPFSKACSLTLGAGMYVFDGLEGFDVVDWQDRNNGYGNSTVDGTVAGATTNRAYATGFQVLAGFSEINFRVGLPVSVFGQWAVNLDADTANQGRTAGLVLGKAKTPRSAEAGYTYRRLEKDATVGFLADSEAWGGGTDGEGHRLYGRYQATRHVQCSANYYLSRKAVSDRNSRHDHDRLLFEVVVRF
jgi:hypothetical protein